MWKKVCKILLMTRETVTVYRIVLTVARQIVTIRYPAGIINWLKKEIKSLI